jgi:GntR family transcriptional regulator/MocR family aminotransferase
VQGVSRYRLNPAGPGGLIFGYATLTERAVADGVAALAGAVAEVRTRTPVRDRRTVTR